SEMTLKQHGAVSAETAYAMAAGLIKTGNCQLAVSTTGIAGPKSDNTLKPVGLAYIGIGLGEDIAVYKFNFKGDRDTISRTAINQALFLAYKRIK
ncbi:MAG: CinA family protein, partial [Candidatus Coproplasma sp.]